MIYYCSIYLLVTEYVLKESSFVVVYLLSVSQTDLNVLDSDKQSFPLPLTYNMNSGNISIAKDMIVCILFY